MYYLQVDFQQAFELFIQNYSPVKRTEDTEDEIQEWFDRWIDAIIGSGCLDGTDIAYLYEFRKDAHRRLQLLKIPFCVINDNGNEFEFSANVGTFRKK